MEQTQIIVKQASGAAPLFSAAYFCNSRAGGEAPVGGGAFFVARGGDPVKIIHVDDHIYALEK